MWSPALDLGLLTPRQAAVLVLAGPGLVVASGLARRGDVGARWLLAVVVWSAFSALVAPHPRLALLGSYGADVAWVWSAGAAGAWGLGRRLRPEGRRALATVLVVGLAANVAFAVLEAAIEPAGILGPQEGRVRGLVSNPVFLASLLTGALGLAGRVAGGDAAARRRAVAAASVVPIAMAINLSGSRTALGGGAVLLLAAVLAGARRSRAGAGPATARALVALGALALGVLLSVPIQADTAGTARLGETASSSGFESRALAWGYGLDAWTERPIAGWGPGRFREATSSRTTAAFVRAERPDKLFYDAHDLFVEHLVTTGLVGLVLLLGFLLAAARRARGPFAWFALGVAVTWLLNPPSATTAPIALLALGAAWTRQPASTARAVSRPGVGRTVGAAVAAVGVALGVNLLVVDAYVHRATTTGDLGAARTAQRLYPGDAVITGLVTDVRIQRIELGTGGPDESSAVVASARRAVREEPSRATWWSALGRVEGTFGAGSRADDLDAAEAAFEEALERSPWSAEAMQGLLLVARLRDDAAAEAQWTERLCEIDLCPPEG
ncbi:MAG: O-antigen ligase family protein [Acidimicrobiales bacterium]